MLETRLSIRPAVGPAHLAATPCAIIPLVVTDEAKRRWCRLIREPNRSIDDWLDSQSAVGFGRHQLPFATMGTLFGGQVRVGLEDNVYYRRGELAESNAQLVERGVRVANDLGREVAMPAQAREILGL